jgi:lysophospholipase L1-like esterase
MKYKIKLFFYLIIFAIFLISLIVSELTFRHFFYKGGFHTLVDIHEHHKRRPNLSEQFTWGTGINFDFYTNDLGWRDIKTRNIKKDNKNRIIFLGDSFVEGVGYNFEDTIPGNFQKLLNKDLSNHQVLNAGTSSHSPILSYQRIKKLIESKYDVDKLIYFPDYSDVQDEVLYSFTFPENHNASLIRAKGLKFFLPFRLLLNNSSMFRELASNNYIIKLYIKIKLFLINFGIANASTSNQTISSLDLINNNNDLNLNELRWFWPYTESSLNGWAKNGLELMNKNINKMNELCKKNNIDFYVVLYPHPIHLADKNSNFAEVLETFFHEYNSMSKKFDIYMYENYKQNPFYRSLSENLINSSIKYIDLYSEIQNYKNWQDLYIHNDIHFSDKGMSLIANKIYKKIYSE